MKRTGLLLVFSTAVISGFSVFTNKLIVSNTDPVVFTAVRNTVVFLLLAGIVFLSGKFRSLKSLSRRQWAALAVIGVTGGGAAFVLFFTGLSKIGAVQGNLIHKTLFLWVAVLAYPILGEKPSLNLIAGYALIILATFVLGSPSGFSVTPYAFMTLSATIIWAFENILAKRLLKSVPHEIVGASRILFGIPVLVAVAAVQGKAGAFLAPATYAPVPILVSAILLTGYVFTWYQGLSYIPVTVATSILVIAPVVTAFLSAGFIDGKFPAIQILPSLILAVAAFIITAGILRKPRVPEGV